MKLFQALVTNVLLLGLMRSLSGRPYDSHQQPLVNLGFEMAIGIHFQAPPQARPWLDNLRRRGVALAGHYAYPRQVTCTNSEGQSATFQSSDCLSAARKLAKNHLSVATCGSCALSLVGKNGRLIASGIPSENLQTMAHNILKACAAKKPIMVGRRDPASPESPPAFGLLLAKGTGEKCF